MLSKLREKITIYPFFIMIAATFWAIDALFRTQLTFEIPTASIVFLEHLIGFIFLSPFFFKGLKKFKTLSSKDWLKITAMTFVSSALATLLFTEALARSFADSDFVTPLLLQKLQPVFVVFLSAMILKEKITPKFLILAVCALFGSYLISFGFNPISLQFAGKELVFVLSIGAAFAWGSGTILSKSILEKLTFDEATSLRFLFAIPVTFVLAVTLNQTYDYFDLTFDHIWRFVVIALITGGAGAMLIYYQGLKHVEAKISTFAELAFPIASILIAITPLNPYGAAQTLELGNILGIIILVVSILLISFDTSTEIE